MGTQDIDSQETQEWIESIEAVIEQDGTDRAHYLIERLMDRARRSGAHLPYSSNTAYVNTIPVTQQACIPGNQTVEHRLRSYIRWNAMAMVVKANLRSGNIGGHIASFASSATLYDVGFNYFFRGNDAEGGGDLVFFQGHIAPGIYARAFLEGRISEGQLENFRLETGGNGLSSYPHPWLMPKFWQFPTVSMGLGPIQAIYQARFIKYLHDRDIRCTEGRHVWAFLGDGEMDEPESLGAITLAGREKLDDLIFVINCNLQRLDGPVRGNGKIIQELEALFRGAGWNVIKVIWGSGWDSLLAKDKSGLLLKRMEEVVDGEYQAYKSKDGAYVRQHFFGKYPELLELVSDMTDEDIWRLQRGGHDPRKLYAAYEVAQNHKGQPTVILAKTVKGYGMGEAGEGQNATHSQKKMGIEHMRRFRDRFGIPVSDDDLKDIPFIRPDENSEELKYLHERRKELGGYLPERRCVAEPLPVPGLEIFDALLQSSGKRELSTTMAFVRILSTLARDKQIGQHIVPIVPDEARTFGMEGMFRQLGIYSSSGQLYEPEDCDQVMWYREDRKGQILQEGINEAGSMAEWIAAGTSYANHGISMIPFYIYYSMFGFQRIGDLAWAAGDIQARGFLLGGTAGRTTLNGEGLQHQDGHGHIFASTIPNCVSYDPTYAYELAVIIQDGLRRMEKEQENIFYYISVMNENYAHPEMPEGAEAGILQGMYKLPRNGNDGNDSDGGKEAQVRLLGSGAILREVEAAADLLREDWGISTEVWSVTSFNELTRQGRDVERRNRLHPTASAQQKDQSQKNQSYVTECLQNSHAPVIAATDYIRLYAEQIRPFVPARYETLGTDGFGRSDTRESLRSFFEVDRYHVVLLALEALGKEGTVEASKAQEAIVKYGIDSESPNPMTQ